MSTEEIIYLMLLAGSYIAAWVPAVRLWKRYGKKIRKSQGKWILKNERLWFGVLFLLQVLCWLGIVCIGLLIFALAERYL